MMHPRLMLVISLFILAVGLVMMLILPFFFVPKAPWMLPAASLTIAFFFWVAEQALSHIVLRYFPDVAQVSAETMRALSSDHNTERDTVYFMVSRVRSRIGQKGGEWFRSSGQCYHTLAELTEHQASLGPSLIAATYDERPAQGTLLYVPFDDQEAERFHRRLEAAIEKDAEKHREAGEAAAQRDMVLEQGRQLRQQQWHKEGRLRAYEATILPLDLDVLPTTDGRAPSVLPPPPGRARMRLPPGHTPPPRLPPRVGGLGPMPAVPGPAGLPWATPEDRQRAHDALPLLRNCQGYALYERTAANEMVNPVSLFYRTEAEANDAAALLAKHAPEKTFVVLPSWLTVPISHRSEAPSWGDEGPWRAAARLEAAQRGSVEAAEGAAGSGDSEPSSGGVSSPTDPT